MKTLLLISTLLCFTISSALYAQQTDSARTFKHDIGFNATFIIADLLSSNSAPFSLMYKSYTANNRANRLGASVDINMDNQRSNGIGQDYDNSTLSFSLTFGKELQNNINAHWIWYYGGDVIPSFA